MDAKHLYKQATGPKRTLPYRVGQWVKFKPLAAIEGAHTLPDGFVVGVYRPGRGQGVLAVNGKPLPERFSHERVVVVTPTGENLPHFDGSELHRALWFPPEACPQLQPVISRSDIPAERLKSCPPDWKPNP